MEKTEEPVGHLSSIVGIGLLLIGLVVFGVVEQKAWSHQAELTQRFEACMESAPFEQSLREPRPEAVLTDEQLQNHFDACLLYTSPSPRDRTRSRMPSSA